MTDKEKVAYTNGFSAAWDYRVGSGIKAENPYDQQKESDLFNRWMEGWTFYEESLL